MSPSRFVSGYPRPGTRVSRAVVQQQTVRPRTTATAPTATLTADDTTVAAGVVVTFTVATTDATSWSLDVGDGTTPYTGTADGTQEHTYVDPANYTATLTATGAGGTGTDTVSVTVSRPATAYLGGAGLYLPAVAGNYASAPDAAPLDLTSSFTIIAYAAADDWTTGLYQRLISKMNGASLAAGGGYEMSINNAGGAIQGQFSNGTTNYADNSVDASLTNGTGYWLRVKFDTTANQYSFAKSSQSPSTALASISWTTVAGGEIEITTDPAANSIDLTIGLVSGGTPRFAGYIARAVVLNEADAVVFDANFQNETPGASSFTEDSSNAATVTIYTA